MELIVPGATTPTDPAFCLKIVRDSHGAVVTHVDEQCGVHAYEIVPDQ